MADVTIVCATHDRAGEVKAFSAFGPELLLSVAEAQVDAYRAAYPDARIDPHPDDVVGLPAKKNWLYEKFGDVFIVDDDAQPMIDHQEQTRLEPAQTVAVIERVADTAEQMGCYLFGVNWIVNPLHAYAPQDPLGMTGQFGGGKFGLLEGSGLWWPDDPKFGVCEDIWMGALNAYEHRFCICERRYTLPTTVGQKGGLARIRNDRMMGEVAEHLRKTFGEAIVLKDPDQASLYYWMLKVPW